MTTSHSARCRLPPVLNPAAAVSRWLAASFLLLLIAFPLEASKPTGESGDDAPLRLFPPLLEKVSTGQPASPRFRVRLPEALLEVGPEGITILQGPGTARGRVLRLEGADASASLSDPGPPVSRAIYHRAAGGSWGGVAPRHRAVRYQDVYPGIDLVWLMVDEQLRFDFHMAPGADPDRIRLRVGGPDADLGLDGGDLILRVGAAEAVRLGRPRAFEQAHDGRARPVDAGFIVEGGGEVRLALGARSPDRPLVIDPIVAFSGAVGGERDDEVTAVAAGADDRFYVAGNTRSDDLFPETSGERPDGGNLVGFVARLGPDGTADQVTYLAYPDGETRVHALVVTEEGRLYVGGETSSPAMPVLGSLGGGTGTHGGGRDGFIIRLDPTGQPEWSTYVGGGGDDVVRALSLDDQGSLHAAGSTTSDDFRPVEMAIGNSLPVMQPRRARGANESACPPEAVDCRPADGFLLKIVDRSGAARPELTYATHLGGNGPDGIFAVAVDSEGRAVVAGGTGSTDLPGIGEGAYQANLAGGGGGGAAIDGFIARLSADGATLEAATYLGGPALDRISAIGLGEDGDVHMTGLTSSRSDGTTPGFPVAGSGALQRVHGGGEFDAFYARLRFNDTDAGEEEPPAGGSSLLHASYLGGRGDDEGLALAIDAAGRVIVTGVTDSRTDFPLEAPWQREALGGTDGFIAVLDPRRSASPLVLSSYFGGSGDDRINSVAVARDGRVLIGGATASADLPGAERGRGAAGGGDGFVAAVEVDTAEGDLPDLRLWIAEDPMPLPQNQVLVYDVHLENGGAGRATGVLVSLALENARFLSIDGCVADNRPDGADARCSVGDLMPGDEASLMIRAEPDAMGDAVLRARILRADQSDRGSENDSRATEARLIVDNSGGRAALSPATLLFLLVALLAAAFLGDRWPGAGRA